MLAKSIAILLFCTVQADLIAKKKHHHKHHHHEKSPAKVEAATAPVAAAQASSEPKKEEQILSKMKTLETELAKKEEAVKGVVTKGRIEVNGPLPADFAERFAQGTAKATGCDSSEVKVIETNPVTSGGSDVVEVVFEA